MMDVALQFFRSQAFDDLCVAKGSQSAGVHDLGLAAGEQAGAVYTGQQANPAGYLAHFVQSASVGTDLIYRNSVANDLLHQLLGNVSNVFPIVRVFFQERFCNFFLYPVYVFFPFQFVGVH